MTKQTASRPTARSWPLHGTLGLLFIGIFWILNWLLTGLRTSWAFFPLWLGYSLTVDALVYYRKNSSMLTRSPKAYMMLFFVSAPGWWLFELLNMRTQNWCYDGRQFFTNIQYFVLCSISFSTVMPAVFGTAELVSTLPWLKRIKPGIHIIPTRTTVTTFFTAGWLMLALLLRWPTNFFPFLWLAVYFIFEPLNIWLGNPSLARYTAKGDWRPIYALWIGCLICGFFWELWNYYSYPKWIYQVPFVDYLHIFEMPLLGYSGYIPFSLELFALFHLVMGLFKQSELHNVIRVSPE